MTSVISFDGADAALIAATAAFCLYLGCPLAEEG